MKKDIKYYDKISSNSLLFFFLQTLADILFSLIRIVAKRIPFKRRNVCIISIHKLGDSIFTFDAIYSAKEFYGDNVYVICNENTVSIYELILDKKFIIPINKTYFRFNDRYLNRKARKILRELQPEVIIDITGVMTSASLIFNSRAKKIIGFNRKIFRRIYDKYSEFNLGSHSREIYTNAIRDFIPIYEFRNLSFNNSTVIKKILIFPFAGWKSKEWSLYRYIALAELLKNDFEVTLIFDNTPIRNEIYNYLIANKINFNQTKTIDGLILEIKRSDMVIGNDSGPVQIAAVLDKFTFSIYGPTNPDFHLPKGNKNFFIQYRLPCSPGKKERICFTEGGKNGCPSFECMNNLTIFEVYKHLNKILLTLETTQKK